MSSGDDRFSLAPSPPTIPIQQPADLPPLFELIDATVIRGGRRALDGITLTIGTREHTAVVGPNGSGKSTLIKLLTGELYPVARLEGPPPVRVFGRERWNLIELRRRVGVVSGDLQYRFVSGSSMGRVRTLDAVLTGFFASELLFFHHRIEDWMRARGEAALEALGAGDLARRRIDELSTGETRRVLIARALVHQPDALVLDEPTAGLDLVARRDLLASLRELARAGTTLFLITHHVEEILPEIERVVLMRQGRVAADGRPEAVLNPELLGAVYDAPVAIRRVGAHYEMRLNEHPPE